jgi:hypothetical protein
MCGTVISSVEISNESMCGTIFSSVEITDESMCVTLFSSVEITDESKCGTIFSSLEITDEFMCGTVFSTELNPIPSMASSVLSTELHMVQQNDSSHSYMVPNLTSVTKTLDQSVILGTSVFSDSQLTHSQEHATPQIHVSSIESSDSLMRTVDTIFYSLVSSIEPIPTLTSEQPTLFVDSR